MWRHPTMARGKIRYSWSLMMRMTVITWFSLIGLSALPAVMAAKIWFLTVFSLMPLMRWAKVAPATIRMPATNCFPAWKREPCGGTTSVMPALRTGLPRAWWCVPTSRPSSITVICRCCMPQRVSSAGLIIPFCQVVSTSSWMPTEAPSRCCVLHDWRSSGKTAGSVTRWETLCSRRIKKGCPAASATCSAWPRTASRPPVTITAVSLFSATLQCDWLMLHILLKLRPLTGSRSEKAKCPCSRLASR